MDFVYNFIKQAFTTTTTTIKLATTEDFDNAGCIFTNGKHVLAGYQGFKRQAFISGIGGRREQNETYIHTALRELIEELFEIDPESKLIQLLSERIEPKSVNFQGRYILVEYTFDDLTVILNYLHVHSYSNSALYTTFPTTISELILNRKIYNGEIKYLALLPFEKNIHIDPLFISDINLLKP